VAAAGEQLDHGLVAVRLLQVEDGIQLALRVLLARRGAVVLRRLARLTEATRWRGAARAAARRG
jgi:hypothetical protein